MEKPDDYLKYNRTAWNRQVKDGNRWTIPVSDEVIAEARKGNWSIVLTPGKPVPESWFAPPGSRVLGLASGGGQQCPVMAAAGYDVTVFDLSEEQLGRDADISRKHELNIKTIQGDMADLSVFPSSHFDMVINPCSTAFVPDVAVVYREVSRVLRPGGVFMTGFTNPVYYLFDIRKVEQGVFTLKYSSPYSDLHSLDERELGYFMEKNEPLVFGHSMEAFIGGQLKAGLELTDLFEDNWGGGDPVDRHFNAFMATRAVRKQV
jgi:SAM-dependent methyltransferase